MQPPGASLTFPCPLVTANDDEASLWVTLRQAHIEHFLAGVSQKVAKLLHCSERRVRAKGSGVMMSAAWALPVRLRNSSRTRDRGFVLRSDSCDHRSNGLRIRRSLDRKGFSSWRGSDDKLWGERDPGLDRTCDKAMGFDAVHGFAGGLEFSVAPEGDAGSDRHSSDLVLPRDVLEQAFGFAFVSNRGQAPGLSKRQECQHHAGIERTDEKLFGRPVVKFAFELRRAANDDVRFSHGREHTAPRGTPGGSGLVVKGLVRSLLLHKNLQASRC